MTEIASFFTFEESSLFGTGSSVSSGPDDGANDIATRILNAPRHRETRIAVDNCIEHIRNGSKDTLVIVGHGSEGSVETGSGAMPNNDEKQLISFGSLGYWPDQIERLYTLQYGVFKIYSCDTGSGVGGAELLWRIAKLTEKPAESYTGFVAAVRSGNRYYFCYQNGGMWQRATPDMDEPPKAISRPPLLAPSNGIRDRAVIALRSDGTTAEVLFDDVQSIRITRSSFDVGSDKSEVPVKAHDDFLQALFHSDSFEFIGDILGILSAEVELVTEVRSYTIRIFNDRFSRVVDNDVAFFSDESMFDFLMSE